GSYDDPAASYDEAEQWPVVPDPDPDRWSASGGGGRGAGEPGSRRRHPILIGLSIFVVLVLVVLGVGWFWAQSQINPGGHHGADVTVDIPKGATASQIGHQLSSAGVIHDASLFALYVHFHGDTLLPGTYSLPKNSSYSTAISALKAGPVIVTAKLVIPEG